MSKIIIKVKDVTTKFGKHVVHDKISIDVKEGEIYGILGGSGSGKTTLLREITLLQKFQSGSIEVLGKKIGQMSHKEIMWLKKNWSVLFQFGALYSSLNVLENVSIPLVEYTNLPKEVIAEIALSKLKMAGLKKEATYLFPSELSGGMKKRAALARALVWIQKYSFWTSPQVD